MQTKRGTDHHHFQTFLSTHLTCPLLRQAVVCQAGGYLQCTPGDVYAAGTSAAAFPTPFGLQLQCNQPLSGLTINAAATCPSKYTGAIRIGICNECGACTSVAVTSECPRFECREMVACHVHWMGFQTKSAATYCPYTSFTLLYRVCRPMLSSCGTHAPVR
jgi:hypothetical protein